MKVEGRSIVARFYVIGFAIWLNLGIATVQAQSNESSRQPAAGSSYDVPDAPSAVRASPSTASAWTFPNDRAGQLLSPPRALSNDPDPPVALSVNPGVIATRRTRSVVVPQAAPRNQLNPQDDLYKILVTTSFVQVPVMVKNGQGHLVYGLLPGDFVVKENGEAQTLTFFTSDPFRLSVAIVLDLGMADVAVQKVHQTYEALVDAFSPYDEFALYTYSTVVTQVTDFTDRVERLATALNSTSLMRGHNNGPPILGGPLGPQPPMINGSPVGTAGPPPVLTPPIEAHVLNDAILRAALDLSKRDNTRRKVIIVISDGRERGSQSTFRQVSKVLQTHGIQVKALVLDQGALPVYKEVARLHHLLWQGYSDILPKYTSATGGGTPFRELSRDSVEEAYTEITSEARNQYTLGYNVKGAKNTEPYRNIEVTVNRKNLTIYAKQGYYVAPAVR